MKDSSLQFNRQEKMLIAALAFFQFTHIVDFMIIMPLGPMLLEKFSISNSEFSLLVSSYTFAAGVSALTASTFIDNFHRKKLLLVVYSAFLTGTFFCGIAPDFYFLLAARIFTGAFGGIMNGLIFSIVGDSFPFSKRGSATGIIMAAFSAATVAGVPAGLWLANTYSWHFPFLALVIAGLFFLIYALYAIPFTDKVARSHPYSDIFREKNHLLAFSLIFFMMIAGFSVIPYISNYLVYNAGLPIDKLPLIYLSGGAATLFTSRIFGYLSDRLGKKKMYYILAGFSMIPIFLMSRQEGNSLAGMLTVTTLFFILVSGRFIPAMALITASVKPGMRGSFMTVNSAIQQFGTASATLLGGTILGEAAGNKITHYPKVSLMAIGSTLVTFVIIRYIKVLDNSDNGNNSEK